MVRRDRIAVMQVGSLSRQPALAYGAVMAAKAEKSAESLSLWLGLAFPNAQSAPARTFSARWFSALQNHY